MAIVELLKPTSGTWRVVAARWLLYMLAMLPGTISLTRHLDETIGMRPWFHDLQPPLEILSFKFVVAELGDGVGLLLVGVFVIWLLQLVWLGGSIRVLDQRSPGVNKKVFSSGWQYLARFLRIAVFAVVATVLLQLVIRKIFGSLSARAETNAWAVYDSYIALNLWKVSVMFVFLTLIGVIAFWSRVIAVTADRSDTRRLPWQALKVMARHPVSGLVGQFLFVCAVLGVQAVALWCWRKSPNGGLWLGGWALLQLLTAYVWQMRIRAALKLSWNLRPE
ncbi:MAG: hypothetical protein ACR2QT_07485 [Woeseiaceae bacterium]